MLAAPNPLSIFTTETPDGAAVQHAEEGGDAAEAGAVADAGGHRDHRHADETGDDARQRAFHAGDDDDHARGRQPGALAQHPMETGDAHVVHPLHLVAHQLRRARRFFRDEQVGGPRRRHDDGPLSRRDVLLSKRDDGRIGVIRCLWHQCAHRGVGGVAGARHQQRGPAPDYLRRDGGNLGRSFA